MSKFAANKRVLRAYTKWSIEEDETLLRLTDKQAASVLGRSPKAIKTRRKRLLNAE